MPSGLQKKEIEIVRRVLAASFDAPGSFPGLADEHVTRNRSLHSDARREMTSILHDSVRWRRRIFGDIAPSHLDETRFFGSLQEAKGLRKEPHLSRWSSLSMDALARELSFPTWLIERWVAQLGFSSAVSLVLSLNEPAPVTFRTNTLKIDRPKLIQKLEQEDIPVVEGKLSPWALCLGGRQNVRSGRVQAGAF